MATPVGTGPIIQDGAPKGGFPKIQISRQLPSTRGPRGALVLGLVTVTMAVGYYKLGQANKGRRAARHEKRLARIALMPMLQCGCRTYVGPVPLKWGSRTKVGPSRLHITTYGTAAAADLTAESAKGVSRGSKDPGVAALAKAFNALSFGVHEAAAQGSCVNDTELCNVLVDLDISPGKPAHKAAVDAAREWATVEDEEDLVEAMRLDEQDVMVGDIIDSIVEEGNVSDGESEDGDESAGSRVSLRVRLTRKFRYSSVPSRLWRSRMYNNDEAAYHLQKARSFIKAYASKPKRHTDIREFRIA